MPMYEYLNEQKEIRKAMTKDEKLNVKEEKKAVDDIHGWAILDGRKENQT